MLVAASCEAEVRGKGEAVKKVSENVGHDFVHGSNGGRERERERERERDVATFCYVELLCCCWSDLCYANKDARENKDPTKLLDRKTSTFYS